GLTHVAEAQRAPVQMLESGPAAGAIAAAFFGRADSGGDLLAFDMGGTTAKLSLVDGGEPRTAYSFEAARQKRFIEGSGLPIRISTIQLIESGAGRVHACHVARKLGISRVICPPSAGVASALGLLVAPARVDRVATVGMRLDRGDLGALETAFRALEDEARAVMSDTGLKLETA